MPSSAIASEDYPMIIDYALGALVTAGLLVYLVYALVRPERF
jgi:K+-transporting ATPase KdpF subunit